MSEFCDDERECESHHVASLWISEFSNISCDINESISMQFDCRKFIKYVDEMRKAEDDREIDMKKMHRCKECKFELFWSD